VGDLQRPQTPLPSKLQALADWLTDAGIDLADLPDAGTLERLEGGTYQTTIKNADGVAETITNKRASWVISPKWQEGPEWQPAQWGPDVPRVKPAKPKKTKGWRTAVCLPDIQAGFWRTDGGTLVPIHDVDAVAAAMAFVAELQPDEIVLHGDNADFPDLSRYRLHPSFAMTAQATIDWLTMFCADLRALCPTARIVWLEGNHEARLSNALLDNARAAYGLRQGQATPETWPVMSLPHLCRLEDSGVEYRSGYPANAFMLAEGAVQVIHGHYTGPSAAVNYLKNEQISTIYGHTHHPSMVWKRVMRPGGPVPIFAATGGCLARLDGSVPSTKTGHDGRSGAPVKTVLDWGHGLVVVKYKGTTAHPTVVPIIDGHIA
jgi:hypothetical protein